MAFTQSNFSNWQSKGEPFDEGVSFYKLYGDSQALITLFSMGANSYSKEKLREALKGLGNHVNKQPVTLKEARPNESLSYLQHPRKQPPNSSASPQHDVTNELKNALIILYKQQSNLHSKMKVAPKKATRKKLAFQILDIGNEIRVLQARRRYIEINGCEPPKTTLDIEDITDRARLQQKLTNNRSYISKNQHSDDPKKKKEVRARKKENREIAKVLNG